MKKLLSKVFQLTQAIGGAIALRRSQRRDRDAFMQLVWQEDRILSDVGYTREDINWAANLPVRMNAAKELEKQAQGASEPVTSKKPSKQMQRTIADSNTDPLACLG